MPSQTTVYRCLIISPSDVEAERDAVERAINHWNAHGGKGAGARLEAVRWESHSRPEMGRSAQEVLNDQIVDECDFGIAVFWSRLGTPTKDHASGSDEEIQRILSAGGNVMVYFGTRPIPQDQLRDDQFSRLQELKRRYRDKGLLASYETPEELERVVGLHVANLMATLLLQERAQGQPIPSAGNVTAPRPDLRVKVAGAFAQRGPQSTRAVAVEAQNHSPSPVFVSSITLETKDGSQVFVGRDALTGAHQTPVKVEPGDSHTFFFDPRELSDTVELVDLVCAAVKDKIDRVYRSEPGALQDALANIALGTD